MPSMMFSIGFEFQVILLLCFVSILIPHSVEGRKQLGGAAIYQIYRIGRIRNLLQLRDDSGNFFCAGSLVAPQYVVTAAECFDDRDFKTAVVIGGAETMTDAGIQRKITKVSIHPDYNTNSKNSNVAVLKLDEPFSGNKVEPIEITDEELAEGDFVTLFGWRHLITGDVQHKDLFAVRLMKTAQATCDRDFNATEGKNHFCVVGNGYDGHYPTGDLGGPAFLNGKLWGIALSCHNCEDVYHTISYTDLYKVKSFVESAME